MGHKTVVMSLDVAHSLADIFDLDRGLLDKNKGQPVGVGDNLWIQELDIQEEIQRYWGEIHMYISGLLNMSGLDEVLAEELAVFPGMEEVSLLLYINKYVREKTYDVILLDCAPTGESLRFISIPTTLDWYMKKIFKWERTVAKYVRPLAKRVTDIPLPDDNYFQAIEDLFEKLKGVDQPRAHVGQGGRHRARRGGQAGGGAGAGALRDRRGRTGLFRNAGRHPHERGKTADRHRRAGGGQAPHWAQPQRPGRLGHAALSGRRNPRAARSAAWAVRGLLAAGRDGC